ncbi:LOW QUALITY PROTEIN: hypothetical protein U9M48_039594, partial [Paspalum notatum var. saurae]
MAFLRTFGCVGHVKNVKPHLGKLEYRSTPMEGRHRMYDLWTKRVHISRDVFDEGSSLTIDYTLYRGAAKAPGDGGGLQGSRAEWWRAKQEAVAEPPTPQTPPSQPAAQGTPSSARTDDSVRFVTPPSGVECLDADYNDEPLRFHAVHNIDTSPSGQALRNLNGKLFMASAKEPRLLEEAKADAQWQRAMEEMAKTWLQADWTQVSLKGEEERARRRGEAQGEAIREGVDFEVFAPVVRMDSMRLLLALAATRDWSVHHLDVKSAFLNGELTEVAHVRQPPGFIVAREEDKVASQEGPIQAEAGTTSLEHQAGFNSGHARVQEVCFRACYVHPTIKEGNSHRWGGNHAIELCQSAYAFKLLERAGLKGCNPTQRKPKLSKNSTDEKVDATRYRSLIGGLRYLAHTRPDIAFAVGYTLRKIMRQQSSIYSGSCELGLAYPRRKKTSELKIIGFIGFITWGGDIDGRKSTSSMVFFLETCPISWQSQKQKIVALSTCEAEYISGAAATFWLRRLLEEIKWKAVAAPILRIDNKSAIELAKNPVFHNRSKHIDIKFHFIRGCVERKQ